MLFSIFLYSSHILISNYYYVAFFLVFSTAICILFYYITFVFLFCIVDCTFPHFAHKCFKS